MDIDFDVDDDVFSDDEVMLNYFSVVECFGIFYVIY